MSMVDMVLLPLSKVDTVLLSLDIVDMVVSLLLPAQKTWLEEASRN